MKTVFDFDKILSAGAHPPPNGPIDPSAPFAGLPPGFEQMEAIYEEEIKPSLADMEAERQTKLTQWRMGAVGGVAIVIVAVILFFMTENVFVGFAGIVVGGSLFALVLYRLDAFAKLVKHRIVSPIVSALGLDFKADFASTSDSGFAFGAVVGVDPEPEKSLNMLKDLNLIKGWDKMVARDRVQGSYGGVDFLFYEAKLTRVKRNRKGNNTTVTVFDGQIMVFDFHKTFAARTVLQRDQGILNRFQKWGQGGLERVALESPEFEKAFEVYSGDQVEARFILTPQFMQSLLDLEADFHGKNISAGFEQGKIYITLQGADMFEPGKMSVPLDSGVRVRAIIDDFLSIFRVIDAIQAR